MLWVSRDSLLQQLTQRCRVSLGASNKAKRAFDVRTAFRYLNLDEFLLCSKGDEPHVADSALGQGDGLGDELLRSFWPRFP